MKSTNSRKPLFFSWSVEISQELTSKFWNSHVVSYFTLIQLNMEKTVNLIAILYSPKYTSKFTYLDNDSWIASKRRQDVPLPGRRFNLGIKILVFIYLSSLETFNLEKVIFLGASPREKFRFHLCEKFFPIISSWKHLLEQILGNQWIQINWRAL